MNSASLILAASVLVFGIDQGAAAPTGLLCELLAAPERTEIFDARPEFGWIVRSPHRGDVQTAYRIRVHAGDDEVWDSGKVESGESIDVEYGGEELTPDREYSWKVRTWTRLAGESSWSAPQTFRTGPSLDRYVTARYPLVETPVAPVQITRKEVGHYLVDFGRVAFGYLVLQLDAPAKGELEIHLGERGTPAGVNRDPGGTVRYARVEQPIEAGSHTYRVRTPADRRNTGPQAIGIPAEIGVIMPFRYCEIANCPVELAPQMVTQVAVHHPFDDDAASFESSDEVLNRVWELCRYSMKATSYCGVYVDGDRERIPYEADAYINQLSHYAVDREFSLARHSHEYLLDHPTWPTEWKQHSVMMAWADLMYTGNTESLAQCYEVLRSARLLTQRARDDGLLDTKGLRDIVDWPKGERDGYEFKDVNTVVNALHYHNLEQMQALAAALGKRGDAEEYRRRAEQVHRAFNARLFDPQRGVYVDGEGSRHASLHANMMPLAFGLVPDDRVETVADFVVEQGMACSVYGAQYLMEGLYDAGRADAAFALLTSTAVRSWYNMLRVGSTITLEAWDDRFKGNQDWNHAWGAVPGNIIPRRLLGVRPIEPGFQKALIRPMPGPLEHAESTIPTIRGPIEVAIENVAGRPFVLKLAIPVNMTARVEVPLPGGSGGVTVDDQPVEARIVDGFAVVDDVGSGAHVFRTTGSVQERQGGAVTEPLAWWPFDSVADGVVADRAAGREDRVEGNHTLMRGAVGSALLFDGFTTVIDRPAAAAPRLSGDFSVEAWVAQGAYPWNWCPIVTQQRDEAAGYAFSVGPRGQIRLQLAAGGEWQTCTSEDWVLPLRKWIHIAATYDVGKGIAIYANGQPVGALELTGQVTFAPEVALRVGANHALTKPSNIHREHGTVASFWCLDGAIDELKIHGRALSPQDVARTFAGAEPVPDCEIQPRRMPSGPKGPGRFGAVYCKLKYYEQWDALWRVDDHPDVLVRFDQTPVRVVFWRGSRYSPAWVTDEDQWMADQSVEAWKNGEADTDGCFEHMQDFRCRYSHVRIIESNDARTVVHWRYAPVSSKDNLWNVDGKTGRACWVDEYYTIYPDALGVRKPTWKKGTLGRPRQFQESLPFTNPDQLCSDVVEKDFCTVANMQGEQLTLRFVADPAKQKDGVPEELTIQRYNFRSPYDPVIVYEPGNEMHYVTDRNLRGYERPGACNHWPVGQARCDGRTVQAADRPTHFLGFPISYPPVHEEGDRCWWNGIYGMTDLPMATLVTLARSWNHPPRLELGAGFEDLGYDRGQRAFVLRRSGEAAGALKIDVAASAESPVYNPAFVIVGWGTADAELSIDGAAIPRGPKFRVGHRHGLEGSDLIVWLEREAAAPFTMTLTPR